MTNTLKKDFLIRKATIKDFDKINSLSTELIGSPIGDRKRIFQKAIKHKNYLCLVAEFNKKIIGFIDMWAFPDVSHGAYLAQIQNLIVAKEFRGMGVGTHLIKKAIRWFKKKGYHELHVCTEKKNKDAIKFYKKLGFKKENILLEKSL